MSDQNDDNKKHCVTCRVTKGKNNFYKSHSIFHTDGYLPICKNCIKKNVDFFDKESLKSALIQMNRPFLSIAYDAAIKEYYNNNSSPIGKYMKNVQMRQYKDLTWKDSDENLISNEDVNEIKENINSQDNQKDEDNENPQIEVIDKQEQNEELRKLEEKNKEDVLRMLGYDPFENEYEEDRRQLYNKLVDYLDEGTLEDNFKIPVVVEIVKTFNHIDKLNDMLAPLVSGRSNEKIQFGDIKSMMDTKDKMYSAILRLAKDNGISVNHSNNKSKGAGTLGGIIKQLQETELDEANVNMFDVETASGIEQVADISNKNITDQLQFDENDMSEMITEQKEMLESQNKRILELEEELRKLRKESVSDNDE